MISERLSCPCGDQPVESSTAPTPADQPREWRTRELKELEDAVNSILRAEGVLEGADVGARAASELAGSNGEPESEAPVAGEAVQAGIERLNLAVMRQVIKPLLESPTSIHGEETWPLRQLPLIVEDTTLLLKKTWGIACARGQQVRDITKERATAEAEVNSLCERLSHEEAGRLAAEAEAGQGEKAHDMLEETVSRLTAARKTIKDKDWELLQAKTRADNLERERTAQERRIRELETALERHVRAQTDAESRISQARAEAETEAAQQRGELRRNLAAAEQARDSLQAEVAATARQAEEARISSEQHVTDLQAQLSDSAAHLADSKAVQEALEKQLRCCTEESQVAREELEESLRGCRAETKATREELEERLQCCMVESQGLQEELRLQLTSCIAERDAVLEELEQLRSHAHTRAKGRTFEAESGESRGTSPPPPSPAPSPDQREDKESRKAREIHTPQREREKRQSGAGLPRAGFGISAAGFGRPPPAARRSKGSPAASSSEQVLGESPSLKSMPMNLHSLGKMLAGSGVGQDALRKMDTLNKGSS